jgi:hypothetical protein
MFDGDSVAGSAKDFNKSRHTTRIRERTTKNTAFSSKSGRPLPGFLQGTQDVASPAPADSGDGWGWRGFYSGNFPIFGHKLRL